MKNWILITLLIISTCSLAQDIAFFKNFSTFNGLISREVHSITRDNQGKFWVFLPTKCQIFDGLNFHSVSTPTNFTPSKYQSTTLLKNGNIALHNNFIGDIYIIEPEHRTFTHYETNTLLTDTSNYHILDGEIIKIIKTNNKYYIKYDIETKSQKDSSHFYTTTGSERLVSLDKKGTTLLALFDNNELYKIKNKKATKIAQNITNIIGDLNNSWILRSINDKIAQLDISNHISYPDSLQYGVLKIFKDQAENTLLSMGNDRYVTDRLLLFEKDQTHALEMDNILRSDNTCVHYFSENFTQNLLISSHLGVWYYRFNTNVNNYFVDHKLKKGGFGRIVRSPFYRPIDDHVYFTKESTGLLRLRDDQLDTILPNAKYPDAMEHNNSLIYDSTDDKTYGIHFSYYGNSYISFYELSKNNYQTFPLQFRAFTIRKSGNNLYVGGYDDIGGIIQVVNINDKRIISTLRLKNKVNDTFIEKNKLIVATADGLKIFDISIVDTNLNFHEKESNLPGINVTCIYHFEPNYIFGTKKNGVYRSQDLTNFQHTQKGLTSNQITSVLQDENKNYWIGTFSGISAFDAEFNWLIDLQTTDGLYEEETNTFAACQDQNGQLYFGTINGISTFHPNDVEINKVSYTALIDEITYYQGKTKSTLVRQDDNSISIPYRNDSVRITYAFYDYPRQSRLSGRHFQMTSSNKDDSILNLATGSRIILNESGNRTLKIIQKSPYQNDPIVMDEFTIKKQSFINKYNWLFISLLTSLAFVYLLIRTQITKRNSVKSEYLATIQKLQLKSLQAQMNPHFIYNALGSIQYFIQKNQTDIADGYLSDFASLMRLILESSKSEKISLKNEIDLLKLYTRLEHVRFYKKFDFKFSIQDDLDSEFMIPPMILQPFVENAILHGFQHLTDRKGLLNISFSSKNDNHLHCTIEDNGIGRIEAGKLKLKQHKSLGTQIVQERIESIEQFQDIKIKIKTADVISKSSDTGTKVDIDFLY